MKMFSIWQFNVSLVLFTITTCNADTYDKFNLPTEDIAATLNRTLITPIQSDHPLNADICFGCADIKYKDGVLKFCECGDGVYMSPRTAWVRLNEKDQWITAPYWGLFWHYLAQFKLPIWFVGSTSPENVVALDELARVGGKYVKTLSELERNATFKKLQKKDFSGSSRINSHKGIIIFRAPADKYNDRDGSQIKRFKVAHPEFLYVNHTTHNILQHKDKTYQAFVGAGLEKHIPLSNVYPTKYSQELVQKILTDIPTNLIVIKPTNGSLACGVNVTDRHGLDALLRLILKDKNNLKKNSSRGLSYWYHTHDHEFIAQEYASSKIMIKNEKEYDPTMRVVFFMHHDQNKVSVNIIGGFWKIPTKSLNDSWTSLTERLVTIAHSGAQYTGILCEKQDWQEIEMLLHASLPRFYANIMAKHKNLSSSFS